MSIESAFLGSGHPPVPSANTTHLQKVLASTDPEQVTTDERPTYNAITVYGYSGYNANGTPIPNVNPVYVGFDEDHLSIGIEAGGARSIQVDARTRKKLSSLWVQGSVGDGLAVEYINH